LHPILVAAAFQVRFIQIHPFGDGNGRMARILSNLVLMQLGYTPAIIRLENRKEYYSLLNLSTLDNPTPLAEMIAEEVYKTLQMTIDASKGLPIEEDDDLEKEMNLLKQKMDAIKPDKELKKRNVATIYKVLENVFLPMLFEYDRRWAALREYFDKNIAEVSSDQGITQKYKWMPDQREEFWKASNLKEIKYIRFEIFLTDLKAVLPKKEGLKMGFTLNFEDYQFSIEHLAPTKNPFDTQSGIATGLGNQKFLYGDKILENELQAYVRASVKDFVREINNLIHLKNPPALQVVMS
jgi:hypothetical protein